MRLVLRSVSAIRGIAVLCLIATPVAAQTTVGAQHALTLLGYHTTAPRTWTVRTPGSSMRLAEFVVPNVGGDSNGNAEVVIYYFGAGQGGGADANLERWKSQFSTPDGRPVYEKLSHDTSGASPLTVAEYRGTYARGIGAGSAPEDARKNNTLIAVVAETPKGTLFFQLFGPNKAVDDARASFLTMVRGMK